MHEKTAFPSDELGQSTKEALARAGTVRLPYPPPASGRLFLGINPDFDANLPSGTPQFFLRLVQTVSQKQVITRILGLAELRGISLPASSRTEGGPSREFRTVNDIADDIKGAIRTLTEAERTKPGVYEVCLFEDAVIFVRESAPVFLRIQYEFAVNAVEAAENVDGLIMKAAVPRLTVPSTGRIVIVRGADP